ncbi:hypothetical protein [Priestia megaterium]|jgi:hypothetical protein|uniref:hypothetical protein n=1 Tax=Priestia megaterium TaxID=1404 RepID=UPI003CF3C8FD
MMEYELPEYSEGIEFKGRIIIFINIVAHNEIIMHSSDFYGYLKETCVEFVDENREGKVQVYLLIGKRRKAVLNL